MIVLLVVVGGDDLGRSGSRKVIEQALVKLYAGKATYLKTNNKILKIFNCSFISKFQFLKYDMCVLQIIPVPGKSIPQEETIGDHQTHHAEIIAGANAMPISDTTKEDMM